MTRTPGAKNVPTPKGSYVYAIHVDGVLRYVGKGTNDRIYAHRKEVRQRLTREFKLKNVEPLFQRKLTEAVMKGSVIEEFVLADNLTSKQAYKLEYRHLKTMVYAGKREQLWNGIPPSIHTPQEKKAYVAKLTENLTSKDRWTRFFSRMQLIRLGKYEDERHANLRRPAMAVRLSRRDGARIDGNGRMPQHEPLRNSSGILRASTASRASKVAELVRTVSSTSK
jgi:hypothetical protein